MSVVVLQVRDWNQHFENNRTRELRRLEWVPVPNKQDGDGYTELMDHKDGATHLGCWLAILQVASKCEERGTLVRDGNRPHDAASIGRIARIPTNVMNAAIERLVTLGWMERIPLGKSAVTAIPQDGATIPHPDAGIPQDGAEKRLWNGMEWNGTELNGKEDCSEPPAATSEPQAVDEPVMEFPLVGKDSPLWILRASKIAEYEGTYPDLDVMAQLRKARQWCIDNREKRKTASGMVRFLGRWLARAQNDHGGVIEKRQSTSRSNLSFDGLRQFLEEADGTS